MPGRAVLAVGTSVRLLTWESNDITAPGEECCAGLQQMGSC